MNEHKLVSVIIPLYNHESYVIETLESIYNSDYTELELLILDDGSNDNGFNLATDWLSYHSSRFVRVWSEKQNNSGINATINKLVNNSKGYYIYLIASDDRVPCNAIKKLVFSHEKAFKGEDGLLFYDVTTINENSEVIEKSVSSRKHASYLHSMRVDGDLLFMAICFMWEDPFQHQFYTRAFYDKIKGYPEVLYIEDVYFALVATSTDMAAYVPVIGKEYRLRSNRSITPGIREYDYTGVPSKFAALPYARNMRKILIILSAIFEYFRQKGFPRIGSKLSRETFNIYKLIHKNKTIKNLPSI